MPSRFLIRFGLFLTCFFASCQHEQGEAGVPPFVFEGVDLKALLGKACWQEKNYFVSEENGVETCSESLEELWQRRHGGLPEEDCRLATFELDTTGWLLQYYYYPITEEDGWYRLRQRMLVLDSLTTTGMVRIQTADTVLRRKSWVVGEEMQLIKASDWEVVLESPVKEHTRRMWSEDMPPNTRCLRSVWTRVDKPNMTWKGLFQILWSIDKENNPNIWRETHAGFVRLDRGFSVLDPRDPLELCPGVLDSIPETAFRLGTLSMEPSGRIKYYVCSKTTGQWYYDDKVLSFTAAVFDRSMRLFARDSIRAVYGWMTTRLITYYEAGPDKAGIYFTAPIKPAIREIWKDYIDENTLGMYSCWSSPSEANAIRRALRVEDADRSDLPEY